MEMKVFQYSLQNIKKLTSYINSPESLPIEDLKKESIGVRKGFQFNFDKTSGVFTLRILIDFLCCNDIPNPINLFGATVQYDFLFKDFEDALKEIDDSKVDIPDELLITLMSISYSTTRGILAMLTMGTDYKEVFLPVVNVQEFSVLLNPAPELNPAPKQ